MRRAFLSLALATAAATASAAASGRVISSEGKPVAGATVTAPPPRCSSSCSLQPDGAEYVRCWCNGIADIKREGRRTTVDHIAAGSYTIELVEGPEAFSPRPVVIGEDQTATVTIE